MDRITFLHKIKFYKIYEFCEFIGLRKRWTRGGHSPSTTLKWIWEK